MGAGEGKRTNLGSATILQTPSPGGLPLSPDSFGSVNWVESSWRKMTFGREVTYESEISEGDPLTSWTSERCRQGKPILLSSAQLHQVSEASLERDMQGRT